MPRRQMMQHETLLTVVKQQLLLHHWAVAHEAHLTANYVPELRQLVQAGASEDPTDKRDAGVLLQFLIELAKSE